MRNDEYDELNDLPSLRAEPTLNLQASPVIAHPQAAPKGANGALWAVVGVLLLALVVLGYWSHQQLQLMAQQLVATQDSFAHISEQAAGRIQDISGKVVAAETAVTSESEQLKLRLKQYEQKLEEALRQQRVQTENLERLAEITRSQGKKAEELAASVASHSSKAKTLERDLTGVLQGLETTTAQLQELRTAQQAFSAVKEQTATLAAEVKTLNTDVAAVKKLASDPSRLVSIEQDLMVLKAQLENTPTPTQGTSVNEFDAYRAQVTRQLNTLNSQVANLQQQLDAR